jgi:hypothetical protein
MANQLRVDGVARNLKKDQSMSGEDRGEKERSMLRPYNGANVGLRKSEVCGIWPGRKDRAIRKSMLGMVKEQV